MKVRLDKDEWYPVYSLDFNNLAEDWFPEEIVDLTGEEIDRITKVFSQFDDMQDYLGDKLDKSIEEWEKKHPEEK